MSNQQFHSIKLLHKKMVSRDLMELRFEKPAGFRFSAGQFVQFQLPHAGGVVLRPFSISAPPHEDYLEFCAKILPDGKASIYFSALASGAAAQVTPADGVFVCSPEHSPTKRFIATGAGLAPIISMIEDQLFKEGGGSVDLLFGVRAPEDIFWIARLDELRAGYARFKFQLTLSRPADLWQGLRGRVSDHLTHVDSLAEYYICGSQEMVADARSLLTIKGLNTKSVHWEIF